MRIADSASNARKRHGPRSTSTPASPSLPFAASRRRRRSAPLRQFEERVDRVARFIRIHERREVLHVKQQHPFGAQRLVCDGPMHQPRTKDDTIAGWQLKCLAGEATAREFMALNRWRRTVMPILERLPTMAAGTRLPSIHDVDPHRAAGSTNAKPCGNALSHSPGAMAGNKSPHPASPRATSARQSAPRSLRAEKALLAPTPFRSPQIGAED